MTVDLRHAAKDAAPMERHPVSNIVWSQEAGWHDGPEAEVTMDGGRLTAAPAPGRCADHPAYDPDYCPVCGTAREIGRA